MPKMQFYYIISFATNEDVMQAEAYIKKYLPITIIPVPREINTGCGLAIRFMEASEDIIRKFCQTIPIPGSLYRMGTRKEGSRHPLEHLLDLPVTT